MNSVIVIGAGGHARSLVALLEHCGLNIVGIFDESYHPGMYELINGYKLLGSLEDCPENIPIVLGIGDNIKRADLSERFQGRILKKNLCHSSSAIEKWGDLGESNQIFASAYLNCNVIIGNNNIINTAAILEHEVTIGNNNHISVNSVICGRSTLGNNCFIGAGSTVIDKVSICDNVIIGAGSVVINSIVSPGTYVGVPACRLHLNEEM